MKIKKSTSGPAPYVVSAIGVAGLSLLMGPAAILTFPFLVALGKIGQAQDLDEVAAEDAGRIAREWKEARKPGERRIKISSTIGSGGLLVDLPMTRTWEVILDPKEVRALDQQRRSALPSLTTFSLPTFPSWLNSKHKSDTLLGFPDLSSLRSSRYLFPHLSDDEKDE